ncbi:hypothetical protein IEQ34_011849 [Dendrobium chrysotoxum]|uniref:Transcriptional coactivator Hfi1/Transcriptional adapter 1 n=1 Tax=Dendrobium chrysotoxum TaxID=161865 RepID=A0AAV7GUV9_DENCH|nr:hypothetical protein IEQ34_011849 [Dendrobium chrysotoxum]
MSPLPLLPTSRVDLGELKSQLAKRLGAVRARRYFDYLQRLLSQKLSKSEFNKLCFLTLGRENLPLHNQLIRSVLKNACQAKAPPLQRKPVKRENGLDPPKPHNWANGDILLPPHCVCGPNERANIAVQQNGELSSYDLERRVEVQGSQQTEQHARWCRLSSKGKEEVVTKENGESLEHTDDPNKRLSPLQAPLGIPFCQARVDRTRRYLPWAGRATIDRFSSCLDNGELCHTEDLRKRMECVAEIQGMGVAAECAVLLNNGLDTYLKRLIKSSIELVAARVDRETIKQTLHLQEAHGKLINGGVWLDNPTNVQRCNMALELQERTCCLISLQDFTGAMELNPQQLGTNAPLLLEKIRFHSLTE